MKTILLLATIMFLSQSCTQQDMEMEQKTAFATKNIRLADDFSGEIADVYFQSWVSGVRGGGSGIDFYIVLTKPLPEGVELSQVYFRDKKSPITMIDKTHYIARFINRGNKDDEVILLGKFKNETIVTGVNPLPLDDTEATLVYYEDNMSNFYLLTNIKEISPLFYP